MYYVALAIQGMEMVPIMGSIGCPAAAAKVQWLVLGVWCCVAGDVSSPRWAFDLEPPVRF